ncbi:hypothetical protein FPQ18DRAFT_350021 [Pyronema domesticum]|nr:hypothetical protein FPQ18DRAFT_350021 [Pyronema domesticum]
MSLFGCYYLASALVVLLSCSAVVVSHCPARHSIPSPSPLTSIFFIHPNFFEMKQTIGVSTVPGTTEDAILDRQFLRNSMDWVMCILSRFLESTLHQNELNRMIKGRL